MPLVNINPLYTAHELEYALNKVQGTHNKEFPSFNKMNLKKKKP